MKSLITLCLSLVLTAPAWAVPVFYTDRAAFDVAVGDSTLLTLDAPTEVAIDYGTYSYRATYDNLITFTFDLLSGVGNTEGFVDVGFSGLQASATSLQPVLAFGVDITPFEPAGCLEPCPGPYTLFPLAGVEFILTQPQFLGVRFDVPTNVELFNTYFSLEGYGGDVSSHYAVDNLSFKTVPEPASLWLLGAACVGLLIWRWERIRVAEKS